MVVAVRELLGRFPSRERNAKGLLKSQVFWGYIFIVGILTPFLIRQILPDGVASVWYMAFWLLALLVIVSAIFALFSDKQKNREADVLAGEASRTMAQWPALLAGSIIFAIGMYYPVAATVTRTHDFFKWPMVDSYDYRVPHRNIFVFRTLEGFSHYQDYPKYRQDFKAWVWMRDNLPEGAKILERPGRDPYSHVSRMSTGSGHPTVIGWAGHQNQWRGRAKAAPLNMKDRYIAEVAGLPDLNNEFNKVLGQGKSTLTTEQQNLLRMSKPKERLKRLREFFPGATLMQLYRLRFIVEKNDVNMNMIMDRMVADAADMYKSDDRERVRSLFGAYDIEYVVVGDLERQEFGSNLGPRFEGWGFTKIYDSAAELLPIDETDINTPTVVYQVPADFPVGEEKR
jgi:hypothetical protein